MARISVPSVQAPCDTPAGHTTASPWVMRVRSSPTWTQPPPLTTMNRVVLGLTWGAIAPCLENASSETCPRSSLQMTCPVEALGAGRPLRASIARPEPADVHAERASPGLSRSAAATTLASCASGPWRRRRRTRVRGSRLSQVAGAPELAVVRLDEGREVDEPDPDERARAR